MRSSGAGGGVVDAGRGDGALLGTSFHTLPRLQPDSRTAASPAAARRAGIPMSPRVGGSGIVLPPSGGHRPGPATVGCGRVGSPGS